MNPCTILGDIACLTGIPVGDILGKRRTCAVIYARTLAFATVKAKFPSWSLTEIAEFLGRCDHGTTIAALKRADKMTETNAEFAKMRKEITK